MGRTLIVILLAVVIVIAVNAVLKRGQANAAATASAA